MILQSVKFRIIKIKFAELNVKEMDKFVFSDLKNIQNYIFDMDGTLINSSREVMLCLKLAFQNAGVEIDESRLTSNIIGPPLKNIVEFVAENIKDEAVIEQVVCGFRTIYDHDENDTSYLYENIYDWLISLNQRGKRLFLATNKPTIPTLRLIKKLKLDMFEEIYTIDKYEGRDISKKEMISEIIEKNGLNKSETIMVGDALSDIKSAHSNEIAGIGVLWGYGDDKEPLKALSDLVINLNDLKGLVAN